MPPAAPPAPLPPRDAALPEPGSPPTPLAEQERIHLLDVLRGVAIFGILLANVMIFSGYQFLSPAQAAALPGAAIDRVSQFLVHALVYGKFYSLFSLLFGIGVAVQMERAAARGAAFVPRFRRRLWALLGIGLAHALLLWSGDILTVYALMGFVMLLFLRLGDRALLGWAVGLLALPVAAYVVMIAAAVPDPFAGLEGGEGPSMLERVGAAFLAGDYASMLWGNTVLLVGRWVDLFITLRFPRVLGMFLLGFWLARRGVFRRAEAHLPLFRRWAWVGLLVALPANLVLAAMMQRVPYLPATWTGLVEVAAYALGVPLLCLGYVGALALVHRGRAGGVLAPFAAVGKMALTNYLLQSAVCVAIFYGVGLGLYGSTGLTTALLIALVVFAFQVPLSALWLERFHYGPVEWVWRQATYGRRFPLRRERAAAPGIAP
jgi:uncharacterized protein